MARNRFDTQDWRMYPRRALLAILPGFQRGRVGVMHGNSNCDYANADCD